MTEEKPNPLSTRLRIACQAIAGFTVMTIGSLMTLLVATLTLFPRARFYADYCIAPPPGLPCESAVSVLLSMTRTDFMVGNSCSLPITHRRWMFSFSRRCGYRIRVSS